MEYPHWPLRALRHKLQQPESYLKEVLDKVAVLAKSGDFVNTWELRPEAKIGTYQRALETTEMKGEQAPDADENEDGLPSDMPEDEDEENVKMEDVI